MSEKTETRIDPSVVVEYLNGLIEADGDAMKNLVSHRVPTNEKMMAHPTVVVMTENDADGKPVNPVVGFLGVLNGLIGMGETSWPYIAAELDEDGNLHRFLPTPQATEKDDE